MRALEQQVGFERLTTRGGGGLLPGVRPALRGAPVFVVAVLVAVLGRRAEVLASGASALGGRLGVPPSLRRGSRSMCLAPRSRGSEELRGLGGSSFAAVGRSEAAHYARHSAAAADVPRGSFRAFAQHFDTDVVVPDTIARGLVLSSHSLISLVVCAVRVGYPGFGLTALLVYCTSVVHWLRPRFSSLRRKVDIAAVASMVVHGSRVAARHARTVEWRRAWFLGVGAIFAAYLVNELVSSVQLLKKRVDFLRHLGATNPGTPQHHWIYQRTALVHGTVVHLVSSTLASAFLIYGVEPRPTL